MLTTIPENLKTLKLGTQTITATDSAPNIGVIMDSALTMEEHVVSKSRSCYLGMRRISKIRRYISENAVKTPIQAVVTSKLVCNNALYYNLPKTLLDRLQMIHKNNAARLLSRRRKFDSIEPIRRDLGIGYP